MTKPLLIIDFGEESLHAGVFFIKKITPGEFFSAPIDGDINKALTSVLHDIREKGYKEFLRVMVGIPAGKMSMRVIALPFYDKKKVEEVLPFEVADSLPEKLDDVLIEAIPIGGKKILAVSVEKEVIQYYLDLLRNAGVDPSWLGSAVFFKNRLLNDIPDHGGVIALVDKESIVVLKDGEPYLFKGLKDELDLRFVMANLYEEGIGIQKIYYLGNTSNEQKAILDKENVSISLLKHNWGQILDIHPERAGVIALYAHFQEGLKDTVNFRKGEFAYTKEIEAARKGMITAGVLTAILLCLLWTTAYLKYRNLRSQLVYINGAVNQAYHGLFPSEAKVVDAFYQLEARLKGLKKQRQNFSRGIDVLKIMGELSINSGKNNRVKLYQLHIEEEKIIAKGEADSFESVSRFKDTITRLPDWRETILTDVNARPGGGVVFSLSVTHRNL